MVIPKSKIETRKYIKTLTDKIAELEATTQELKNVNAVLHFKNQERSKLEDQLRQTQEQLETEQVRAHVATQGKAQKLQDQQQKIEDLEAKLKAILSDKKQLENTCRQLREEKERFKKKASSLKEVAEKAQALGNQALTTK